MGRFRLSSKGVRELLKSEEMLAVCRQYGAQVQQRAGEGFVVEDRHYPERSGVAIRPEKREAYRKNFEENTLLKALGK